VSIYHGLSLLSLSGMVARKRRPNSPLTLRLCLASGNGARTQINRLSHSLERHSCEWIRGGRLGGQVAGNDRGGSMHQQGWGFAGGRWFAGFATADFSRN
jgi:hypothetical protein